MKRLLVLLVLLVPLGAGAAVAADPVEVLATLETEPFFEADEADADDPARTATRRGRALLSRCRDGRLRRVSDRGFTVVVRPSS